MATETIIHPPRTMMEVFNSLPEGTNVQLIENNLVMSPAPVDRHAFLIFKLCGELYKFITTTNKGVARTAPYDVYLDKKNAYQPDIIFVLSEREHLLNGNGLYGAPDLVIEILSPSTAKYDLHDKKDVYERCGVKEYWIIDPADDRTTGYYLVHDEYHEFFTGKGRIESKLLGWQVSF